MKGQISMARKKKVEAATLDVVKLEPPQQRVVTFKNDGGNGWHIFASGTDDEHEAIHMVMAIAESVVNTLPPICSMFEAVRQPDGSWRIGGATPEKVMERLFAAMQRERR
jgi:hypothetical protein